MRTLPRQAGTLCAAILGVHAFMSGSCFLTSLFLHDRFFESHWEYSTPCTMRRQTLKFWRPAFHNALSTEERQCLEAWISCCRLMIDASVLKRISSYVYVQDSVTYFDGFSELRDGLAAFDSLLLAVSPCVLEVRRERQGDCTFLHAKVEYELLFRLPFTRRYVTLVKAFPAVSSLQLDRNSTRHDNHLIITAVEHRWFGGCIFSHQTNSVRSPWGDLGDLARRYNAFMLSLIVTRKTDFTQRVADVRASLAERERVLREQQHAEMNRATEVIS